jgi:outer membrane lipoprotein-sorting protein
MLRKMFLARVVVFLIAIPVAMAGADAKKSTTNLTAQQIVEKNVNARGGIKAWRAVETMSFSGKMEAGTKSNVQLPFALELKRGRKSRLELQVAGKTAVQVYDGANGWKVRPFLNRLDVEPYTVAEAKQASAQSDLDGLLIDYAAKGTKIALEGVEKVEDRRTYKLMLTLKDGEVRHVWVDAETFLEAKLEGTPRRLDGKYRRVSIYLRSYKPVQGVVVPYVIETAVEGVQQTEKILVEKVSVNPRLDDSRFAKPVL